MSNQTHELLYLSGKQMAALVRERQVSSAELMTAHIRRIEEVNPKLNAIIEPLFDSAMSAARKADEKLAHGEAVGAFHGVPFSVKDSIDVAGARTTAGTMGRKQAAAAVEDACLVARLRAAGAIPIAKTNLPDLLFAYESDNLLIGRTNNPYDLTRSSGGSSGGDSALIGAAGAPFGLGSDSAGSVRVPAAFCGIASLKPTSGRLPRTGHVPPFGGWSEDLWQIGPMARRVEDLELMMETLAGPDGRDFLSPPASLDDERPVNGLRVAYFTDNGYAPVDAAIKNTVESAAQALGQCGATVEAATPPGLAEAFEIEMGLFGADGCEGIDSYLRLEGSTELHPLTVAGFLNRMRERKCTLSQLAGLWARWDAYRHNMAGFFRKYDVVVGPVYTQAALRHGDSVTEENFRGFSYTMAWNVGGNPAATVRSGEDNGLPLNVQIMAARWNDRLTLTVAKCLERESGGWQPSPLV